MEKLNNIPSVGKWNDIAALLNSNLQKIEQELVSLGYIASKSLGYYTSLSELSARHPKPSSGDWAIVDGIIYECQIIGGVPTWSNTGKSLELDIELSEYLKKNDDLSNTNVGGVPLPQILEDKLSIVNFLPFDGIVDSVGHIELATTGSENYEILYVRDSDRFAAKVSETYYSGWGTPNDVRWHERYGGFTANKKALYANKNGEIFSFHNGVFHCVGDSSDIYKEIIRLEEAKQDRLVSGVNIKTVNGATLLGSGNIEIVGGGGGGQETGVYISSFIDL